jgi:glycine cleavage system aminomethyltransferase T
VSNPIFQFPLGLPAHEDLNYYEVYQTPFFTLARPWEFNGWKPESLSWKKGCYLHTGLSRTGRLAFRGPEAGKFLESLCINSFAKFPVGSMKHGVMCNRDGLIAAHGIIQRQAEDEYHFFAGGMWPAMMAAKSRYQVEVQPLDHYLMQIAGPTSLQTLERATGESLGDLQFLRFRHTSVDGLRSEVGRIGMSGNLAYELRGPIADAPKVFDAVYRAGRDFGIERLGWRTYLVNHVEGGFPQVTWTMAAADDEDGASLRGFWKVSGSVDPVDMRARYRTPVEVGWGGMARFDHEFHGRAAVEAEVASPQRTVVTLRWHPEDVIDIYASLLRPGEEFKTLDLPYAPGRWPLAHADHLLKDGRQIGYSSGTIYSYYFREVLSLACIDVDAAALGTEVTVQWGDFGGRIKNVRATVQRFPYLQEARNSEVDATRLR